MTSASTTIEYLQSRLETGDFLVPASEADVNNLAVIHALRATADGMKQVVEQQGEARKQMSEVMSGIHEIDKRLAVIEANSLSHKVEGLDTRVQVLEDARQRQLGAVGLADWMGKNWPAILAFGALVMYLVSENGITI